MVKKIQSSRAYPYLPALGTGAAIAVIVGIWCGIAYLSARESTNDAFIESPVVTVSSRLSAHVAQVMVTDNQSVNAGDQLVQLDARDYQTALDKAVAERDAAAAESDQAEQDVQRYQPLYASGDISRQQWEEALARSRIAVAGLARATALAQQAQLDLSYASIIAPADGRVTRKNVEPGTFIQRGQPLLAIVPPQYWVIANFKETQLEHIRSGQRVLIRIDSCPGQVFNGHVDSIQQGTGSRFSLLPPENATGNFIKVVQRVPVKIVFDDPVDPVRDHIAPGMSAVPTVLIKQ